MVDTHSQALNIFAASLIIFVFLMIVYGIIYIHDIPHRIAQKRNHPHQDAIHVAGWISLFLLHVIWPLLWIWAMMHKPDLPQDKEFVEKEREIAGEKLEASATGDAARKPVRKED
ncbi:MAG: DUF3302 domain-containing protein [Deltaproteobacteria bacterium]|nr:DUF3302 domain-containing protein [Deltaproteobacteria bacterium]